MSKIYQNYCYLYLSSFSIITCISIVYTNSGTFGRTESYVTFLIYSCRMSNFNFSVSKQLIQSSLVIKHCQKCKSMNILFVFVLFSMALTIWHFVQHLNKYKLCFIIKKVFTTIENFKCSFIVTTNRFKTHTHTHKTPPLSEVLAKEIIIRPFNDL